MTERELVEFLIQGGLPVILLFFNIVQWRENRRLTNRLIGDPQEDEPPFDGRP